MTRHGQHAVRHSPRRPALALCLLTSLGLAAYSDGDGEPDLIEMGSIEPADTTDTTGIAGNGDPSVTSTAGVACDYVDSTYNDSVSVQTSSTSEWSCSDTARELTANGIPDHPVGTFPNEANPNTITEQDVAIGYTLAPVETDVATQLGGPRGATGFILNGVKMDPGAGGACDDTGTVCSLGDNSVGQWAIEALSQDTFDFGTDENNAHVQPDGTYHYHGMPEGFVTKQGGDGSAMTLIGWAADGFPIYARHGYTDAMDAGSGLRAMTGSWQLVETVDDARPSVDVLPLGTFGQDWEYVAGSGDLDERNGRTGVTPEFPGGTYHYYATDTYPFLQRCVKGEVEAAGGGPGGPPKEMQP